MKKPFPALADDAAAEAFVAQADLSAYDLAAMSPMRFEFAPKASRINMRLPDRLLAAVKARARDQGLPYQRFIRQVLEREIGGEKA